jgi:hypothetical protein
MNNSFFLSINQPCDETLQWAKGQLSQSNLRAVQTFDLQAARAALPDCSCPNHGTDKCDCQMVVLLVYGKAEDVSTPLNTSPVTLILHGNNGQTWFSIADNVQQISDKKLADEIRQVLQNEPTSIPLGQ